LRVVCFILAGLDALRIGAFRRAAAPLFDLRPIHLRRQCDRQNFSLRSHVYSACIPRVFHVFHGGSRVICNRQILQVKGDAPWDDWRLSIYGGCVKAHAKTIQCVHGFRGEGESLREGGCCIYTVYQEAVARFACKEPWGASLCR